MAWGERGESSASYRPSAPTKSSQANLELKQVLLACLLCKCILKTVSQLLLQRGWLLSVWPWRRKPVSRGTGEPAKRETRTQTWGREAPPRRKAGGRGRPEPSPRFTGCGQPRVVTVLWNVVWLASFWVFCLLVFFNESSAFGLESLLL